MPKHQPVRDQALPSKLINHPQIQGGYASGPIAGGNYASGPIAGGSYSAPAPASYSAGPAPGPAPGGYNAGPAPGPAPGPEAAPASYNAAPAPQIPAAGGYQEQQSQPIAPQAPQEIAPVPVEVSQKFSAFSSTCTNLF